MLTATTDTQNQPGVRQLVSVYREPDGTAHVQVEYYDPWEWDRTLSEAEHAFPTLDIALEWLESQCGVHWSLLHVPNGPPPMKRTFSIDP